MSEQHTKVVDMSRFWRIVVNEGGLIDGKWWVTRPDDKGRQNVKPLDVVMWSEGRHHDLTLYSEDFTAFIKNGEVEPIRVHARHDHVQSEAENRLPEIAAVVLAVSSGVDWSEVTR